MAREFKGKLSPEDVEYLQSRFSVSYVDYMIGLHGTTKGGKKASEEPESGDLTAEEDLIGDVQFDVLGATEAEVGEHLASLEGDALEAEKARLLEAESNREDREPRKGVAALLQPAS